MARPAGPVTSVRLERPAGAIIGGAARVAADRTAWAEIGATAAFGRRGDEAGEERCLT
jgi:hypothetical protein